MRLFGWALLIAAGALLPAGFGARAGDDEGLDAALERLEATLKQDDADAMCRAVREVAGYQDRKVDRALRNVATRSREDRACAEAARMLAMRGGRSNLGFVMGLVRRHEDRPYALIGDFEALGLFASPRSVELLFDQARQLMPKQQKVAIAALEALGRIRHRDAVDRLVDLLVQTELHRGYGPDGTMPSGPVSDAAAAQLDTYRPGIVKSLRELTGVGLEAIEDWVDWWRSEKKRFRCPEAPPDPNRRLLLEDDEHGFEITRPGAAWTWSTDPEEGFQWTCRRLDGERPTAWLSIHVHSTKKQDPITVPGMLGDQQRVLEGRFRTVRESEWDGSVRFAGVEARRQHVVGVMDDAVYALTQAVFMKGDRMYVVRWVLAEKAPPAVAEEQERMLGSFELSK